VEVKDTFGFNAPAEIVYSSLTDPNRADRWLPVGVRIADVNGRHVRIQAGDRRIDLDVATELEELRLTARCTDPVQIEGTARVTQTPVGGSQIDVVVTVTDGGPSAATVRDALGRAMRHLRSDVDDNFTPG